MPLRVEHRVVTTPDERSQKPAKRGRKSGDAFSMVQWVERAWAGSWRLDSLTFAFLAFRLQREMPGFAGSQVLRRNSDGGGITTEVKRPVRTVEERRTD